MYRDFIAKNELIEMNSDGELGSIFYEYDTFNPWDLQKWNYDYEAALPLGDCTNCVNCYAGNKCDNVKHTDPDIVEEFIPNSKGECQSATNYR